MNKTILPAFDEIEKEFEAFYKKSPALMFPELDAEQMGMVKQLMRGSYFGGANYVGGVIAEGLKNYVRVQ